MAYNNEIGSKYEVTKELRRADVAKLIRADLKDAFPGMTFSVRTENYSGGGSIDILIKSLPAGMFVRNPDNRRADGTYGWMTDEAIRFQREVEAVAAVYNFDRSDIQTDYFHVRFYCNVAFSKELTNLEAPPHAPRLALVREPSELEECEARWTALLGR